MNAPRPVQFGDQARLLCDRSLDRSASILLNKLTSFATGPPVCLFRFIRELWNFDRFLSHRLFASQSSGEIILPLASIQIVRRDHANLLASFDQNNGE